MGIVVFLSIRRVATPPTVSIDSDSGVTSIRIISFAVLEAGRFPPSFPPWMQAPKATHSSGFKPLEGSFPKSCLTFSCTAGILVEPPTRSTIPRSEALMPASCNACCTGAAVRSTRSRISSLNVFLESSISRCSGVPLSEAIKGILIFTVDADDNAFFAFSASSRTRCSAVESLYRS